MNPTSTTSRRRAAGAVAAATVLSTVLLSAPSTAAAASSSSPAPGPDTLRPVPAVLETPPLFGDKAGGRADADDPAIWVNRRDRAASRVIATAKTAGLRVYDLQGHEVQSIPAPPATTAGGPAGRLNNVDLLTGVRLGGSRVDLAVASDRGRDQLRFYRIDPVTGLLTDVTSPDAPLAFSADQAEVAEQATVYGLDAFTDEDGSSYVLGTRRHSTTLGLFKVLVEGDTVTYRRVDVLDLPSTFRLPDGSTWSPCEAPGEGPQSEGTVVDPENEVAYVAQEDVGLWRLKVSDGRFHGRPRSVERTREFGVPATFDPVTEECVLDTAADKGFGGRIAADVEGLTIYPTGRRSGTLVVSSQGDDTFYTYDRRSNRPRDHFAVVGSADGSVDGSQSCDGADATSQPLPGFPNGLLVVQDGENTPEVTDAAGEVRPNTHFLFVDAGFLR